MTITDRHYKTRCTVPMVSKRTGEVEFNLVLYGVVARDLQSLPNEIVASLAHRYPDHISSMFLVRDGV
jgi:hypothetical protein